MVTHRKASRPRTSRRPANGAQARRAPKTPRIPKRRKGEELHAFLRRLGESIPPEELANFPTDGAANHDHYIYGTSKQY